MKKLLPILFVLIITSCSKEVPSDQLVERNGIYYEVNSQTGFTGTSISYYENGQLEEKITYTNGELDGSMELYFGNGQLQNKVTNKNGVLDGPSEVYFKNGQLQINTNFKNGELDGHSERYYPNGLLSFKGTYKNGELDGLSEEYYEGGQVKEKSNYKDGLLDGPSETYLENGQVKEKSNYKDGLLDGPSETYFENGQVNRKRNYKEGILKEIEYYDEKGNKVFFDITKRWIIDFSNHYPSNIYTFTPNGNFIDNDVTTPNKVLTTKENSYWEIDNRKLIISINDWVFFEGFLVNDERVEGVILTNPEREKWGTWTMKVYDEKKQ
ncbi:toxin-antitoxin system YwqK family antitoxin [Gammaproteobacteria bacterium]|nr:toxin-antitoxin system YwqK family antitoxin [Gammaproteobacteria bacterium]